MLLGAALFRCYLQFVRFACGVTKARDAHREYVILIAFPHQQWLLERSLMLRLYLHCMFCDRGADKTLARPGRKQATATEDFDFHISYL